jgi:hypothetical protein
MIEKSKPQTIYPYTYPCAYNLRCDDIDGCRVGTKNRINKFQSPYEYNLNIKDVFGAQSGTLKKGIITDRNVNPIYPKYNYIGQKELGKNFENAPFGDIYSLNNKNIKTTENNVTNKDQEIKALDIGRNQDNQNIDKNTDIQNFNNRNNNDLNNLSKSEGNKNNFNPEVPISRGSGNKTPQLNFHNVTNTSNTKKGDYDLNAPVRRQDSNIDNAEKPSSKYHFHK